MSRRLQRAYTDSASRGSSREIIKVSIINDFLGELTIETRE